MGAVSIGVSTLLNRTTFGKALYLIANREAAAYLAGIRTRRVVAFALALCGLATALSGVMVARNTTKAYQRMGDAYLLPAIAAVVVGGTNILGGRDRYLGTLFGVISIVLLNSVPSIMHMSEASRQIVYSTVTNAMLHVVSRYSAFITPRTRAETKP
jgi:ribose transport system permease protein